MVKGFLVGAGEVARMLGLSGGTVKRRIQFGQYIGGQDHRGRWGVPLEEMNRLSREGDKPHPDYKPEDAS